LRTIQRAGPNSADRWLADFLGQLQRDDLAPATVRSYRYDLRQFLRWLNHAKGPSARFEKLSAIDLINYRQHLLKVEGLRPATVNRRLEALRRFCRWAHTPQGREGLDHPIRRRGVGQPLEHSGGGSSSSSIAASRATAWRAGSSSPTVASSAPATTRKS
jgi:integrase